MFASSQCVCPPTAAATETGVANIFAGSFRIVLACVSAPQDTAWTRTTAPVCLKVNSTRIRWPQSSQIIAAKSRNKKREYESVVTVPFRTEPNCSLSVGLSGPVKVPCGRPQIHFSPRVINGLVCPKGHCPWQVNIKLMKRIRKTGMSINRTAEIFRETNLANPSPSKIYSDLPGNLCDIVKPTPVSEIISRPF